MVIHKHLFGASSSNYLYTEWCQTMLKEIKESVQSDFRHQVSLLVQPMLQVLDAAFAHYEANLQKRSAKSGERPNGFI